jgi:hypothetical protein
MRRNPSLQRASAPLRHTAAVKKRIITALVASALVFLGLWQPKMRGQTVSETIPVPKPVEEK